MVSGTLEEANSQFGSSQRGPGLHHHIDAAIDRCRSTKFVVTTPPLPQDGGTA